MDPHSTVDRNAVAPEIESNGSESRAHASVSAGIAAANAHLPGLAEPGPHVSAEEASPSLAEMAHRDLDAALQLLAERAQYITAASGAAIALRRGEHNDMLCRASAGSNAPELGAILSMEYGLSGESVRTRQTLRCDDTENDPRVNREGCRQLGIASVVVMPVVSDQQVLGVFELFSRKPRAFETRDISALQRLSEMVETAVRHAVAAQGKPPAEELVPLSSAEIISEEPVAEHAATASESDVSPAPIVDKAPLSDSAAKEVSPNPVPAPEPLQKTQEESEPQKVEAEKPPKSEPASKKPLFWSAAQIASNSPSTQAEPLGVPPVLRNLQKCQACGFPVSQGRTFCVECEEKQWRGQRLPAPDIKSAGSQPAAAVIAETASIKPVVATPAADAKPESTAAAPDTGTDQSTLFLSSAAPSESWLAANKYILAALLIVAIVVAAVVWLR